MNAITLELQPIINLTDEQYYQLCRNNPDIKLERNAKGQLIVMPPTGGNTGRRNLKISGQLAVWEEQNPDLGVAFDSSTEFKLPRGGDRSPDAAWVKMERWEVLTRKNKTPLRQFVQTLWLNCDRLAIGWHYYKQKCKSTSTAVCA